MWVCSQRGFPVSTIKQVNTTNTCQYLTFGGCLFGNHLRPSKLPLAQDTDQVCQTRASRVQMLQAKNFDAYPWIGMYIFSNCILHIFTYSMQTIYMFSVYKYIFIFTYIYIYVGRDTIIYTVVSNRMHFEIRLPGKTMGKNSFNPLVL